MTAVAALQPTPADLEPRVRAPVAEDLLAFRTEIQQVKREPAKSAAPAKDRRARAEDPDALVPEVQLGKVIDVKREVADVAQAIAFAPVKPRPVPTLEVMIEQSAMAATKQVAKAASAPALPPMTPLERAVHDLIDQLRDSDEEEPRADPEPVAIEAPAAPPAPALAPVENHRQTAHAPPVAPVRELDAEEAQPLNPSHVHLVIDEAERIVVTVAVRGDNVLAHVRGGDDAMMAMLARNAATLDNMMRARGLQLTEFQASRDGSSDTERDPPEPQREKREADQPKFTFEETP